MKKLFSPPLYALSTFIDGYLTINEWTCFGVLSAVPLSIYLFSFQYHIVITTVAFQYFEIRWCDASNFILLSQDCFRYLEVL